MGINGLFNIVEKTLVFLSWPLGVVAFNLWIRAISIVSTAFSDSSEVLYFHDKTFFVFCLACSCFSRSSLPFESFVLSHSFTYFSMKALWFMKNTACRHQSYTQIECMYQELITIGMLSTLMVCKNETPSGNIFPSIINRIESVEYWNSFETSWNELIRFMRFRKKTNWNQVKTWRLLMPGLN